MISTIITVGVGGMMIGKQNGGWLEVGCAKCDRGGTGGMLMIRWTRNEREMEIMANFRRGMRIYELKREEEEEERG